MSVIGGGTSGYSEVLAYSVFAHVEMSGTSYGPEAQILRLSSRLLAGNDALSHFSTRCG